MIHEKFFSDPEWPKVEEMMMSYVDRLTDMTTIDTTQPAEHVKAEIVGRILAHNLLVDFLRDTKIITRREIKNLKNPFV